MRRFRTQSLADGNARALCARAALETRKQSTGCPGVGSTSSRQSDAAVQPPSSSRRRIAEANNGQLKHDQPKSAGQQKPRQFRFALAPRQLKIGAGAGEENKSRRAIVCNPARKEDRDRRLAWAASRRDARAGPHRPRSRCGHLHVPHRLRGRPTPRGARLDPQPAGRVHHGGGIPY